MMWVPENVKLAVTPDEMDFVPAGMEQVINIGHRPCTANTMIEMLCDWIRECNGRKKIPELYSLYGFRKLQL